jgi:hypothetical protein
MTYNQILFDKLDSFFRGIVSGYQQLDAVLTLYTDEPVFRVTIALVPGLISISYPLIIQTISRLNDQYKSTHIVDRFRSERRHKWFFWSLIAAVALVLLCTTGARIFILFAFTSIINLLFAFFLNIRLLLIYQSARDLFNLFSERLNIRNYERYDAKPKLIQSKKGEILVAWHSLLDLYGHAIINRDRRLQEDIRVHFIGNAFAFVKYIEQKEQEVVLFPTEFYNGSYEIIATFIRNKDENFHQNIEYFIGTVFFTTDTEHRQFLHQNTYYAMWTNLSLLIENDRSDKVIRYWASAHQYCRFNLESLSPPELDNNYEETERSKTLRQKLQHHKKAFIQLHVALGAYLMYKKKWKALEEVWFYSQSQPPSYVLIPLTTTEIFNLFFLFSEFGIETASSYTIPYSFRDLSFDAMNGKTDVRSVVRKYLGLLFLKLWITPSLYGQNTISVPKLPDSQSEKKHWEDNLIRFKKIVQNHLNDAEILEELGFDLITPNKCLMKSLPHPLELIENIRAALQDQFTTTLKDLELDPALTQQLDEYTIRTITETYHDFQRISGPEVSSAERDEASNTMQVIRGNRVLLDKEAFVSNASTSYIGYQTVLANHIGEEYRIHIATKFSVNTSRRYTVKNDEMFAAVDRLNLNGEKHALVAFNLELEYLKESKRIALDDAVGNEDFRYKGLPIYTFRVPAHFIHDTLYALRQEDFPMIKHKDWRELNDLSRSAIAWWENLELVDENLYIYRKFTELADDSKLLNEYLERESKSEDELKNMVDINFDFLGYCWFKKGVKIVSVQEIPMFQEGGETTSVEAIGPFEEQ